MGHQINFYITPKDTADIEQKLRSRVPLTILHSRSPSESPRVLDSLNFEENGQPWLSLYLVRPEDLEHVVMHYVSTQGYWTVEVMPSPVIEFDRCFFDHRILRRGRVYYTDGFYNENDIPTAKSGEFKAWAKTVFSTMKKMMKRLEGSTFEYIAPDALAWLHASNGELDDGHNWSRQQASSRREPDSR